MGVPANFMRRACAGLLDTLLPPACMACATPVLAHATLCAPCFASLTLITAPFCNSCGLPFCSNAAAGSQTLCPTCLRTPPAWGLARAALLYDDGARALILPFKHAGREALEQILAIYMARAGRLLLDKAELLVPVPLHPSRLRQRGFNQSARLAQAIGRIANRPTVVDGLQRVKPTPELGALSATARAEALSDAILVRSRRAAALAGRHILLVDDVMTSGATAAACTHTLLAAGATSVNILVAARVPDPRAH